MNSALLILSTLATLYTAPGGPTRGPASDQPSTQALAADTLRDPCEGRGRVEDVPSPYDDLPHTCLCAPVKDVRGVTFRMDVRCW